MQGRLRQRRRPPELSLAGTEFRPDDTQNQRTSSAHVSGRLPRLFTATRSDRCHYHIVSQNDKSAVPQGQAPGVGRDLALHHPRDGRQPHQDEQGPHVRRRTGR
jgi:hypothetical protein